MLCTALYAIYSYLYISISQHILLLFSFLLTNIDDVCYFLQYGRTPFKLAFQHENENEKNIALLLLEKGADPNLKDEVTPRGIIMFLQNDNDYHRYIVILLVSYDRTNNYFLLHLTVIDNKSSCSVQNYMLLILIFISVFLSTSYYYSISFPPVSLMCAISYRTRGHLSILHVRWDMKKLLCYCWRREWILT